jgi:branched-chain amino acid transport system permease protein
MAFEYLLTVGVFVSIFSILTVSLNILIGYARQISAGHAAFWGMGAYASAILTVKYDLSFWEALPLVILITTLIGIFLGLPSLRVSHDFLVLVTIGLNFIVVAIFAYSSYFGGSMGIVGIPKPTVLGKPIGNLEYFLLAFGFLILIVIINFYFLRTWARLGMEAMGGDDIAARFMGINVPKFKIYAFAISSAFAGIAGSLWAHYLGSVFPEYFDFTRSVEILAMLVFGGMGTIRGAVFGAVVLVILPEYLRFIENYRMLVYGGILILMILVQPMGFLGKRSFLWNGAKYLKELMSGQKAKM